jgi:hypothetical protein
MKANGNKFEPARFNLINSKQTLASEGYREGTPEWDVIRLINQAWAGDIDSALRLVRIAVDAATALEHIAEKNPSLLGVARRRICWPVLAYAKERQPERITRMFERLQLGKALGVELTPGRAKWKQGPATDIAYQLFVYVWFARKVPYCHGSAGQRAKTLKPFDEDSWKSWWEVAKQELLASYPEPEEVPELERIVTDPKKRRTPGRLRAAILKKIWARFKSLAPAVSHKRKSPNDSKAKKGDTPFDDDLEAQEINDDLERKPEMKTWEQDYKALVESFYGRGVTPAPRPRGAR